MYIECNSAQWLDAEYEETEYGKGKGGPNVKVVAGNDQRTRLPSVSTRARNQSLDVGPLQKAAYNHYVNGEAGKACNWYFTIRRPGVRYWEQLFVIVSVLNRQPLVHRTLSTFYKFTIK